MKMDPELHDILKLCDDIVIDGKKCSPHQHPDLVQKYIEKNAPDLLDNPTVNAILRHHEHPNFKLYPNSPETLAVDIADNLASALSRALSGEHGWDHKIFRLWRNTTDQIKKRSKISPLNLDWILDFIRGEKGFEDFLSYCDSLMSDLGYNPIFERAEDSMRGANITSLYTHLTLSGKFYRLMQKAGYWVQESDVLDKPRHKIAKLREAKTEKWTFQVCRATLQFPQKPIRSRDMNVFHELDRVRRKIEKAFPDEIFFNTTDEMLFVLPLQKRIEDVKPKLNYGFWVEYEKDTQTLSALTPHGEGKSQDYAEGTVYAPLESKIVPPICEICQMAKAEKEWPKHNVLETFEDLCPSCRKAIENTAWPPPVEVVCEKDLPGLTPWLEETVTEALCRGCFDIRKKSVRLTKLADWSEKEERVKVVWIKITLDFNRLCNSLHELHVAYLKDLKHSKIDGVEKIRFSVLAEFNRAYKAFLDRYNGALLNRFGDSLESKILDDFFVARVEDYYDIVGILEDYQLLYDEYFPRFKVLSSFSPVKLGVSGSGAKFPFFEHWQILRRPKSDVYVSLIDKGEMLMDVKHLPEIIACCKHGELPKVKRKLFHLAKIAEMSEKLAEVTLKSDRDFEKIKNILPMGLDFQSILTLAKLLGDRDEIR